MNYYQQALKFNQGLTAQNDQWLLSFERLNLQL
jgi:hypothetical protein